jgi:Ca-activated chloride channel family protein
MYGSNPLLQAKHTHLPAGKKGDVQLKAELDRSSVLNHGDAELHVAVTVDTHGLGTGARVPTDFVVVLDQSGSMSGQKIEYGKQALRALIERLNDHDRLALIAYASEANVRVPIGDEAHVARERWLRAVDDIGVGGGTNISEGLSLGLAQLSERRGGNRAARVLLLSDGQANAGDTSIEGMGLLAREMTRADSVLSTIGIGADFDEEVMTSLARSGTGGFYYLAKLGTLPQLLDAELKTASETYAANAELFVKLAPGVQLVSASGRSFDTEGGTAIVPLGSLYAEHSQQVWLTLKVPNQSLEPHALGSLSVRYRRDQQPFEVSISELPKVEVVADSERFEKSIVQPVWERAVLEEDIAKSREQLGAAIRGGTAEDVDKAVASANVQRRLAEKLGNRRVLSTMQQMSDSAAQAKAAQAAGGLVRAAAAKNEAAASFGTRNRGNYKNVDPTLSY